MSDSIRIKPHHFVDIIAQIGTGEPFVPHPYGHGVHIVAERVLADPETMLRMDWGADDICSPCVHNIDGLCDDTLDVSYRPRVPKLKREWNLILDRRWSARLGLAEGDCVSARRFCELLRDRTGDISDIYAENPPAKVEAKAAGLAAGIERFLAG